MNEKGTDLFKDLSLTRRDFLKGLAAAGLLGGSLGSSWGVGQGTAQIPKKWDKEADVVIIGYGGAGASAAITAHDAGAKVLVVEKMPFGGGNTGVSGGAFIQPTDLSDMIAFTRAQCYGATPEEFIRAFSETLMGTTDWLEELGGEVVKMGMPGALYPTLPGAKSVPICYMRAGPGEAIFKLLSSHVESRGIKVLYETPAKKLIQNPETKEILGIIAEGDGAEISFKAKMAVILACGGYENNPEMLGYFNFPGIRIYPWGTPGNTGDGIKMASEAGAQLWHMICQEWALIGLKAPSELYGNGFTFGSLFAMPGAYLYINKYGKRFMNESIDICHRKEELELTHFDQERVEYPNIPSYIIFDEALRKKGPLWTPEIFSGKLSHACIHNLYEWSADNSAEIAKGWITKAGTINELATKIGVDAATLKDTMTKYNHYCDTGEDPEFGRPPKFLIPLKTPPYYAAELCLVTVNTQGGPKRNGKGQVLDYEDVVIPRLYAAGECGSIYGFLYQGGGNVPEALMTGHNVGRNAAAEKPWK